jgi:hypothetical protein
MCALQLPSSSEINFTDDAIRKAAEGAKLPYGWHPFVVTASKAEVVDKEGTTYGNLVLKLRAAALADPTDVSSKVRPEMFMNVTLPFANPNVPGHAAPEWAPGICAAFFRAVNEELPVVAREGGTFTYQGEAVEGEELITAKADSMKHVYEAAQAALGDPASLIGSSFYGLVGEKKGFVGIQQQMAELPADAQLVDLSDLAPKAAPAAKPAKKTKR